MQNDKLTGRRTDRQINRKTDREKSKNRQTKKPESMTNYADTQCRHVDCEKGRLPYIDI